MVIRNYLMKLLTQTFYRELLSYEPQQYDRTLKAFIISLQSLLCDPNPNSPANSEAARMFSENKREYNRRVREIVEQSWTAD